MTTLTIIPSYDRKRLKSVGTVAAGEHVEVTILGGADWIQPDPDVLDDSQTLRLRLIFGGKTVAVFPYWTETHEDDLGSPIGPDQWDESQSGEDAVCEINLNTIPAEKMLRFGGQCLWVLDDPTNHILYGTGEVQIGAWPRRRGTDTPYDLDGYPDFVEYAKAAIESAVDTATGIVATATSAASTATAAASTATTAATTAGTYANTAGSRMAAAENARDAAALSATAAGNAQTAAETAQGKAEDAQAAAETAQEKAEAWTTGGTGGTPGATNNAKYWAEQAAETLEDKADKVKDATEGNFAALDDEGNLADSGKNAEDFAASEHSHAMSEVTGLSDALDAKGSAETLTNVANKVATLIGNVTGDDARSVREIAALAIAAWAAGADARYDTLKEIADWILNDTTGAAKMASDIATLAANKVDKVSGYGLSKNDFTDDRRDKLAGIAENANNYTLPTASASTLGGVKVGNNLSIDANGVLSATGGGTVDPFLSPTSENPVKSSGIWNAIWGTLTALPTGFTSLYRWCVAQLAGKLNRSEAEEGFTEWRVENIAPLYKFVSCSYSQDTSTWTVNLLYFPSGSTEPIEATATFLDDADATELVGTVFSLSRTKIRPTKTSELTNDGDGTSLYATVAALAQKASLTDLPYALVTPGEWKFSGVPEGRTITDGPYWQEGDGWIIVLDGETPYYSDEMSESATSLTWNYEDVTITATRPSLPGHLCDRAVNTVAVSTDTTLTLPALVNAGKARDLLVRLEISGSAVPTITFSPDGNESVTYETDGDEFPVPDEAGTWLYSFTESAAHTFAVSLKKVNEVAQAAQ